MEHPENPVVSEAIEKLRAEVALPQGQEDHLAQEARQRAAAAEASAEHLRTLLRAEGEPDPQVEAVPDSIVGPVALARVAGYPLLCRYTELQLLEVYGRSVHFTTLLNVQSLAVYGDPSSYADPRDYAYVGDESDWGVAKLEEVAALRAEDEAQQAHSRRDREARDAYEQDMKARFTPFQRELADKPMHGEVTYWEWLAGAVFGGQSYNATESIKLADQLIRRLRPDPNAQ